MASRNLPMHTVPGNVSPVSRQTVRDVIRERELALLGSETQRVIADLNIHTVHTIIAMLREVEAELQSADFLSAEERRILTEMQVRTLVKIGTIGEAIGQQLMQMLAQRSQEEMQRPGWVDDFIDGFLDTITLGLRR